MPLRLLSMTSILALTAGAAAAQDSAFNRIASFAADSNIAEGADREAETSAEIIDASEDGMTLIYTDSPLGTVGLIDISDAADPQPGGTIDLGGEPTSVVVIGSTAYVGVNTSESFTDPSGHLAAIDMTAGSAEAETCDLGGQPDSIAAAPDGSFVTVAIENERDEDLGDGRVGQMPAGELVILPLAEGAVGCEGLIRVDVTGLAEIAPEDPEPEFVDVNEAGEIVLTLQENNHIVVVSSDGTVLNDFSAGTVDLTEVDATEDDALSFTESLSDIPREPDAVKWIDADHFATANEGDMDGGSRGWSIFHKDGTLVYDSGNTFEHALIEIGHYPEGRSENKGVEPESVETATFDGTPLVFIGSERGSAVGVYDVTDPAAPVLLQILPSGIGPEGYVAIPERGLLVSANETDLGEDGGPRAHVMIFEHGERPAQYPTLTSAGADALIGWGALSGLVAGTDGMLYAVNDSFYAGSPMIFTIDPSQSPARITTATPVTEGGETRSDFDMEGIALDGQGDFWIANEGHAEKGRPQAIFHVGADGAIIEQVDLPADLTAGATTNGLEGITLAADGSLWMAVQREWADDPEGMVKLLNYDPESGAWTAVHYPLETAETGWVGLSEITFHDGALYLIERDNQIGAAAQLKQVTRVSLDGVTPAALGGELAVVEKEVLRDLIPDLQAFGGYVVDKVEGLAITEDGTAWALTDNDGVDDSSGETFLWSFDLN
ncbi:esterase-like activity of phytase family protein [Pseudoroseicyclus aestuarii]|uniref:Phytase-like protein with esterase activity n=1 Tax=Pseudoroseicyclus aestuarii TaxID=1795041 RepID=A0A318SQ72_9RHOB|nr:esterase-like activity of phytase family protein [Pseudoroseicyclus aestuarii]PYE83833.1 phytase-like protein with esterase activity [Pseudoroseicyclus aestuarii]